MKYYKWNDQKIIFEIQQIINTIGHFPTENELKKLNNQYLVGVIYHNGGFNKFRSLMGYDYLHKPKGYWTDNNIIKALIITTDTIGHFPTSRELFLMKRYDLVQAIIQHGGMARFRELAGYRLLKKPSIWNDKTIIEEIKLIINQINHFPTQNELLSIGRNDLNVAIARHGGLNKFKIFMGYKSKDYKIRGFWNDDNIIKEIEIIIQKNGYFPTWDELLLMNRNDLANAITRNGGISKFRELMGYNILKNPDGYWTDNVITEKLKKITNEIGHFPTSYELKSMNENSLIVMMIKNGGLNKFRKLLGFPISIHDKYIAELSSYTMKRGKSSERIVKSIIIDYCSLHNIILPQLNVNLSPGHIIEFVCNTGKTIGIDITNTKTKSTVYRKYTHKSYHLYLDELWIVVFSDVFTDDDYLKWNQESPENVKVFSIHGFLDELDYSLSEDMKNKIDKYCSCTFHTKEELKDKEVCYIQNLR